jgi:DNA recombination protein RmuC
LSRSAVDDAELTTHLQALSAQNERLERELRSELSHARTQSTQNAQAARGELGATLGQFSQALQNQLANMAHVQHERLSTLTQSNEQRLDAVRTTLEQRLELLRNDNAQKLEQMRATVDEKLHATLELRLGESFKQVSDRLEQVHRGLGEMQSLAAGVGDLKKVLTNVKTRGTWGEVQLENLLEQILIPSQYDKNVITRPGSNERVEFAIRLPGRDADGAPCLLPIDAKFPLADYQQLVEAQERGDPAAVELHAKALERRIKDQAADIHGSTSHRPTPRISRFSICQSRGSTPRCCGARPRRLDPARLSGECRGPHDARRDVEQSANGLSYARDRAAIERGMDPAEHR